MRIMFVILILQIMVQTICPYVAGNAVYKARTLNYYLQPGAMYDDMKNCNAAGVYKQGNSYTGKSNQQSLITMEGNALAQLKADESRMKIDANDVILFPNPTDRILNIRYNQAEESELIIMDATGRRVMHKTLPAGENTIELDLQHLAIGLYTYIHRIRNINIHFGKINKQ